ncbi:hypothetical protein ABAC460_03215 [Asticcacaulis sp. AC460]|uniref:GNAT family N-acetyltransferase n=1 Tax=Asticcacaulis sp. AC460 TaxID=1282360 RepID=UPI0003C3C0DA|nr:GNAT family N-acetyltransferase [Asticcacaulis sp. AC460]ESQ91920.1 hypothetical protein ABAC460_03215 [Asticcacaulis sp. AC460]
MEAIVVRPWRPEDGPAAAELIRGILNEEFGFATTRADLGDVEHNAYGDGLWVAEDDGCIVGTIALLVYGETHGALRRMFVAPDRRGAGLGIGQALMESLLAQARLRDLDDVSLGTLAKFDRALGFYAKNGYVQIPRNALPSGFPAMPLEDIFCRLDLRA